MKRYAALKESDIRKECAPTVNDPQNKALAGVGIPMKLLLWRGSILNLPKRKAENTEIRNAGPDTLNKRANMPSKKSNTAPSIMKEMAKV